MRQFEEIKDVLGESLNYYLIAVDMNSNYMYINKRYNLVFEPIHGDLFGQHYSVSVHPDDQQTCKIVSQMAFKYPGKLFPATLRKHDGRGKYMMTRWEYQAIFDSNMVPQGIFCIGHDITELMELSTELESLRFTQSHIIRKPIANLIGLGKLLESMETNNDVKDVARMIQECTNELDHVIRNLGPLK